MKTTTPFLILRHFLLASLLTIASVAWAEYETGVAKTGVNFRASPNGRILTGVGKGEHFDILGTSGNWTQVRLADGRKGFIYSKYVGRGRGYVAETEGGFCEDCLKNTKTDRLPVSKAEDIQRIAGTAGAASQCLTRKMIEGAKNVHRTVYGGRTRGKGKCGVAVRRSLNKAGIWQGGGIGHARDMKPGLLRMGFKDIKTPGMTPDNAPAGTILVYGRALKGAKGCRGLGTTYGHIEIKENNKSYIYDGNPSIHIQKSYGAKCRPLIGVMQMGNSCPTCTSSVKKACGVSG